ncbi:MAG: hypothetical protein IIY06_04040 [Proteobacteria bacterium]|nr:hypothetical protein [Pseudomonadota bacterium]
MKKQTILALSVMTLSCMLFNTGCAESKNDSAESKNDSSTTTLRTTAFEGAQGNCNNGGVKLEVLVDGVVDDAQTQYICNGANGQSERDIHNALVATSDEVGETCANGGIHMDFGLDANDNGTLDAGEILGSRTICHGTNGENGENGQTATIHTTAFEDVQGGCNYGGIKAEVLIDNVVQADQTQYICNGANGQNGQDGRDGQDGHIALVMSSDEVGDHCSNGGIRLNFGLDTNDNGLLDNEEILSFHYICNGSNGLDGQNGQDGTNGTNANIVTTVFEGEQGSCMNGGVKVDVLIDGVIQTGKTQYICNGVNGADGQDGKNGTNGTNGSNATIQTTSFTGAQGTCTNGGVKIDVLVDGVILPGQTQYICNGANGANGTNGTNGTNASIMTTAFDDAQGSCNNGGVKIEVLVDGVVQDGQTQYICNSLDSIGVCLTDNDCRETAYCDQTTLMCVHKKVLGEACTQSNQCSSGVCLDSVCLGRIGDVITFGHYEQDNDTNNGKEPIEWRVLDKNDDGQVLVISEKVLDRQCYNKTEIDITWEKSTIRSWLNGYPASYNAVGTDFTSNNFIDAAFTAEEKAKIVASYVPAHANPSYSTSPGNATTDKVFLLSIIEANTYLPNKADRRADMTLYLARKIIGVLYGVDVNTYSNDERCTHGHCYPVWILRSPGGNLKQTTTVDGSGDFGIVGVSNCVYHGVRPALWVEF